MLDLVVIYLDNMAEKKGAAIEVKVEIGDRDINDNSSDLDATDTKILEFIHGLEATFFKVKLSTYMYNPVEASLKADTEDVQVTDQNPRFLEQMMMQPQVTLLAVSSFDNDIADLQESLAEISEPPTEEETMSKHMKMRQIIA